MRSTKINLRIINVLILAIGLLLVQSPVVNSQTITPAIMAMVNAELQKRGLTEDEVRVRLLQKGIDLENIPTSELPQYQQRVVAVLDELEAEKKLANQSGGDRVSADSSAQTFTEPVTTNQEAVAEAAQRVIQADAVKKKSGGHIYGHSLFTDQSLEVFRTTDGAQAPETYVLGNGDEIRITIFGASQTDIQQKIEDDGSIQPSGGAKIFVKGLTLAQAREVLENRLSASYTFRSDQFAVTIITARTILVNVFGEAKVTGGFTISALNSALNALSAAGGPTEIGSVRNIQLIRGNTRKNIDLYTFMNDPAAQFRFDLQNNDIIFVPVVKLLVSIEGAVKRPMLYEMLPEETLSDLIRYAGDVKMDVFPDFVQIQRYVNGEQRLFEYNLEDVRSGKTKVALKNGDIVRIKSIEKPMDQFVDIEGSVYYPGRYDLASNPTLKSILDNAKPTYQAKTDILFVERIRPDETVEVLTVPFPGTQASMNDFSLVPRDKVRILDQATYRDVDSISVAGYVRIPFKKAFSINDHITVKQAIELAGGLKTSVYPVAYIFRHNLYNRGEVKYIRIELSQADQVELQAGDQLNIYDNTTYTNVGEVRVFGAIKNPRRYTYDPSLTVRDVLTNSGGFTLGAALNRVEIFRTILSPTEKSRIEMITLEVDSSYQVVNPENFKLQPFDQVVIRLTPEFTLGRTIEINGQVKYPGAYALESRQVHLSEVINMAGGLLEDADPIGSGLFRTYRNRGNISMDIHQAMLHAGALQSDPILFEGDVININRLENTVSIRGIGTRMAQYSIHNDSIEIKNVIYQGNKSAGWYIRNYAGGFKKRANRNSVTVNLPNDQMISTKRFLFVFRNYPTAKSGSMITLQMKPPKEINEAKKTDWDSVLAKTVAATTSVLTLILLFQRL
ncbi:MAG: SLBB domain-containing protein [Prolixibacteraceae bacterium]|jgi:protein involved in polysaccharide export with SLBB domain